MVDRLTREPVALWHRVTAHPVRFPVVGRRQVVARHPVHRAQAVRPELREQAVARERVERQAPVVHVEVRVLVEHQVQVDHPVHPDHRGRQVLLVRPVMMTMMTTSWIKVFQVSIR